MTRAMSIGLRGTSVARICEAVQNRTDGSVAPHPGSSHFEHKERRPTLNIAKESTAGTGYAKPLSCG
jgi:hypothetical protein